MNIDAAYLSNCYFTELVIIICVMYIRTYIQHSQGGNTLLYRLAILCMYAFIYTVMLCCRVHKLHRLCSMLYSCERLVLRIS